MKAGIVIEDNFFKVSYLIVNGRLSYTNNHINTVKLANPKLPIFTDIISNPQQRFTSLNGQKWNHKQLMSILFKKALHEVNSNVIDNIETIKLALPNTKDKEYGKEISLSLKANDIKDVEIFSFDEISESYINKHCTESNKTININLADENICFLGTENKGLIGFKSIQSNLIKDCIDQCETELNINLENNQIDTFLLKSEINKIYKDILNDSVLNAYTILLKSAFFRYSINMNNIYDEIDRLIKPITEVISTHKYKHVTFTGRYAKSNLIEKRIKNFFLDLPITNIEFDKTNEIKSKGILYN